MELLGGDMGNVQADEGYGAQLGVFGLTEGVVADRGGEAFLYLKQNPSLSSLFYFECPNCLLIKQIASMRDA